MTALPRTKRPKPASGRAHRIVGVYVEDLFGMYTYDINLVEAGTRSGPSLLLLYGDNGSGKTTILRLVYHLLGREDNLGHRSYLARTPFRRVRVTLDTAIVVEAVRSGPTLVGDYSLRVLRSGRVVAEAIALTRSDLRVVGSRRDPSQERDWQAFIATLSSLELSFFYLSDDRRSEEPRRLERPVTPELIESALAVQRYLGAHEVAEEESDGRLRDRLDRLERWLRDEALRRTNLGEEGTRVVYADIVKRIAASRASPKLPSRTGVGLGPTLLDLENRSQPFADLGLVSPPHLTDIAETLKSSPPDTQRLIGEVVTPYIDSLRKRLDAQQDLMELVSLFLSRLNQFFRDKTVSYRLTRGLQIITAHGDSLDPLVLSSGERQLLSLLAEVLMARSTATVFLIDEPEISLNVKWQRMLVDTLLQLVRGTDVQFILATHSLELLASHRDRVFRLGLTPGDRDDRTG